VHKFQRSSKAYKDSLAYATIVPDTKHHLLRYKEERKTHVLMGQSFGDNTSSGSTSDGHDEDDSDEDDSDDDQVVTGAAEKPAPHPVIARFEEWLESPDGGRDRKTVKQHSSQLWKILTVIDDSGDISSLHYINLVRHLFLKKHMLKRKTTSQALLSRI
jgi:hypothetical protein